MVSTQDSYFYDSVVGDLQVLAEEATRARPDSPESRFVAPEGGVIDRTGSSFHHVLYGRRGSGKSSLLRHVESMKKANGHLVAWTDQEVFMGLEFPDVLVSTLAAVFDQFREQIRQIPQRRDASGPRKLLRRRSPSENERIANELALAAAGLETLKLSPSESDVEWTSSTSSEKSATRSGRRSLEVGYRGVGLSRGSKRSNAKSQKTGSDISQKFTATKAEHLERAIPTYRRLMTQATSAFPDAFVILDDFYRLADEDQPRIAGYFHRVVKDTGVWLKIGSIQYRTRLYSGSMNLGVQESHDVRVLSLDRGLLDFESSKRFLERILSALAEEVGVDVERLLSDGAKDRLVLAAGGVPRDYLGLLGGAIAVARNRGSTEKSGSDRVIAEDVNEAAGRTLEMKVNDLEEDAGSEASALRTLLIDITNHCRRIRSACFLVDFQDEELSSQIRGLQNMRFVHTIDTNESLPDPQSSRYNVFLLDVSQLVAQRAWQVDFMGWTSRSKRRARKLVFQPGKTDRGPPASNATDVHESEQLRLLDESAIVGTIDPPVGGDML